MAFQPQNYARKRRTPPVCLKGSGLELLFTTARAELVPLLETHIPEMVERSGVAAVLARHALQLVKAGKLSFIVQGDVEHFGTHRDTEFLDKYLVQPLPTDQALEEAETELGRYFKEMDYYLTLSHMESLILPVTLMLGYTGPSGFCYSCGVRTRFIISKRPDVLFERRTHTFGLKKPKDCYDSKVAVEVDVKLPTGEIFVGDWLRHDGISAIVGEIESGPLTGDLNSASGRMQRLRYLIKEFGMVNVPVSNGRQTIFKTPATGALALGVANYWGLGVQPDNVPIDWDKQKDVQAAYRGVTIWDLCDIVKLMMKHGMAQNPAQALKQIREAVKADERRPSILRITPGTYRLRVMPNCEPFPLEHLSPKWQELHASCTLSPVELDPVGLSG